MPYLENNRITYTEIIMREAFVVVFSIYRIVNIKDFNVTNVESMIAFNFWIFYILKCKCFCLLNRTLSCHRHLFCKFKIDLRWAGLQSWDSI